MLKKLRYLFDKIFFTSAQRARMAGVVLGEGNFISCDFWSTEPYLITIGNYCQITRGVKIHTHGGGGAVRFKYPQFNCFGKVFIGDYVYLGNDCSIMPGVTIGNNVLLRAVLLRNLFQIMLLVVEILRKLYVQLKNMLSGI